MRNVLKVIILTLIMVFSCTATFGQRHHRHSRGPGLLKALFVDPVWGDLSIKSVDYAYYPLVNQSSIRLNWRSGRYRHCRPILSNELQVDFLPVTWMFPNSIHNSWGSIGASLFTLTYRFGESRIKPFVTGEFLGIATCSESLGEKLPILIMDVGTKRPFISYCSASAGLDCYLGTHTMLKVSAGIMDRCIIKGNYLYPYGAISFVYEHTMDSDTQYETIRYNN